MQRAVPNKLDHMQSEITDIFFWQMPQHFLCDTQQFVGAYTENFE